MGGFQSPTWRAISTALKRFVTRSAAHHHTVAARRSITSDNVPARVSFSALVWECDIQDLVQVCCRDPRPVLPFPITAPAFLVELIRHPLQNSLCNWEIDGRLLGRGVFFFCELFRKTDDELEAVRENSLATAASCDGRRSFARRNSVQCTGFFDTRCLDILAPFQFTPSSCGLFQLLLEVRMIVPRCLVTGWPGNKCWLFIAPSFWESKARAAFSTQALRPGWCRDPISLHSLSPATPNARYPAVSSCFRGPLCVPRTIWEVWVSDVSSGSPLPCSRTGALPLLQGMPYRPAWTRGPRRDASGCGRFCPILTLLLLQIPCRSGSLTSPPHNAVPSGPSNVQLSRADRPLSEVGLTLPCSQTLPGSNATSTPRQPPDTHAPHVPEAFSRSRFRHLTKHPARHPAAATPAVVTVECSAEHTVGE